MNQKNLKDMSMRNRLKEYDLHGLVRVVTNIEEVHKFLSYFCVLEANPGLPTIIAEVSFRLKVDKSAFRRIGDFYYHKDKDELCFELPFIFPLQLLIKGLSSKNVSIFVSSWFLKLPTILRGGINFAYLFREIMLIKLIEQGAIFLHSGCVDIGGRGLVFCAFPNTGKTYLSFGIVKSGFARLLSDEYIIAGEGQKARAFFTMSALSPRLVKDFKIKLTLKEEIWMLFCKIRSFLLPFLFEAVIWVDTTRIFPKEERKEATELDFLFFLERADKGMEGIKEIEKGEALRKLIIFTENEFPFIANYVLQTYSCANSSFDLIGLHTKFRKIIQDIAESAKKSFVYSFKLKEISGIYKDIYPNLKL